MTFQQTLSRVVELEGTGLHTGEYCQVRLLPADTGVGVYFVSQGEIIPAHAKSVIMTERATVLGKSTDGIKISTVEHLLAALSGLEIDNVRIEVSGSELPALDGSAREYVEKIQIGGVRQQESPTHKLRLTSPIWIGDERSLILALPSEQYSLTYIGNISDRKSKEKTFTVGVEDFISEIAPARTFVNKRDIEGILAKGLGKGGSLDNVIVIDDNGTANNLRFEDEPLRHKILDLLGDLSLIGRRLIAHIIAVRSGHRLNIELVKRIIEAEAV